MRSSSSNSSILFKDQYSVRSVSIPYVPKQVELDDLHKENGKLLSNAEILRIQGHKASQTSGIYDKTAFNVAYDIIAHEGHLWAIYKEDGAHALGSGSFGQVLLAQDLQTGQFYALKKQQIEKGNDYRLNAIKAEFDILKDLGEVPYQSDLPVQEFAIEVPLESEEEEEEKEEKEEEKSTTTEQLELTVLMELIKGFSIESLTDKEDEILNEKIAEADEQGIEITKEMLPSPLVSPLMRIQMAIAAIKAEIVVQEAGYLHRDASPGNIIFDPATQTAKMIDFGHSRKLTDGICQSGIQGPTVGLPLEIRAELAKLLNSIDEGDIYNPTDLIFNDATESYTVAVTLSVLFGLFEPFDGDVRQWENRAPIIASTDHPSFEWNTCGLEGKQMERILNMLLAMSSDVKERMSMRDGLVILEALRAELIAEGKKINTGVLDMTNCLDEEGNIFPEYAQGLKGRQVEEVWLISSSKHPVNDVDTLKVARQLEAMGFRVGDKVYIGKHTDLAKTKLEQHLSKRSLPSDCDTWSEKESVNSSGLNTRRD